MAAAVAVEMLVSLLHHPAGVGAPAQGPQSVPHQLRGYINTWQLEPGVGSAYSKCVCCSDAVQAAYAAGGADFVLAAVQNPATLEAVVGLTAEHEGCADIEVLTDSDDL